jgi:hypothetical protein
VKTIAWLFVIALSVPASLIAQPNGSLSDALGQWRLAPEDLGAHPKGYWTRFPLPERIPHLLPSFPDLWAEPLMLYDYGRTSANAAARYLDPSWPDTPSGLHNLVYFLGVDKRVGSFRNYSTNMTDTVRGDQPLERALASLWIRTGERMDYRAFGNTAEYSGAPDSVINRFAAALPGELHMPLAVFIANIEDAHYWWTIAVRNTPADLRARVLAIRDLSDTQGDGTKYYPEIDDAARMLDETSLYYACMKVANAAEKLALKLKKLSRAPRFDKSAQIETPLGSIIVGGSGSDDYTGPALAIIDLGGADTYEGSIGTGADVVRPFGIVVDIGGNDHYASDGDFAQGAGVFGCGVVYDAAGNDTYEALNHAQGFGLFGLGVLYDREGDDHFTMHTSGQGCGYFGIGLMLDGGGKDECRIWAEGQGQGGVGGGVGVLAALGGNDLYYAEPDATIAGRADYHSEHKIAANNAQGSGNGRRGDGSDGHAWAGGLGMLLDIGGSDRYESGNWSQGIGYWFGTGILYDSEGDDVYKSVYFTQASGAHFCNGVLIDEAGNDRHECWFNAGAAIAFGWDYTNALLIDKSGNDYYDAKAGSIGLSSGRSTAILYDGGGDDEYRLDKGAEGFGMAARRDDFFVPDPVAPYMYYSKQVGMLLDTGGKDTYLRRLENGTLEPDTLAREGASWRNPPSDSGNLYGGGFDLPSGVAMEFEKWDK